MSRYLLAVPASFFSIVLGVGGLAGAWGVSHSVWYTPAWVGHALGWCAAVTWLLLAVLYAAKWIWARAAALAEFRHPIQCCFVGVIAVSAVVAAVGCVAYESVSLGPPDLAVQIFLGYALFQALILIRLLPWIWRRPFTASYWAFTFGVSALPTAMMRFLERGGSGPIAGAAPYSFVAANIVIAAVAAGTLWLLIKGTLLPAPVSALPTQPT